MTYKISKLIILFVFATLIISCKKNETSILIKENPITKKSINEQRQYVRDNFKQILQELKPIFYDAQLKAILYSEVAKKFDGDDNVLIKTLINNQLVASKINKEKVNMLLEAFHNIDGSNYYPQIYIPNFDKLNSRYNLRITSDENQPEFIIYDGDETINEFPIYIYNEDGEIYQTDNTADENYAISNPIYIISFNENVNDSGNYDPIVQTPNQTNSSVNCKIFTITIKDLKENFVAGKSEVNIKAFSTTWNHLLLGISTNQSVQISNMRTSDDNQGHQIVHLFRAMKNQELQLSYPLITNWEVNSFFSDPIVYTYCIFEADKWPTPIRVSASLIPSNPNSNSNKDFFNFRSADDAYGSLNDMPNVNYAIYGNVSGLPNNYQSLFYDGHVINTDDIKFTTKKY